MKKLPKELIEWWEGFRPDGWTLEQHIDQPFINMTTSRERKLALYIVKNIK